MLQALKPSERYQAGAASFVRAIGQRKPSAVTPKVGKVGSGVLPVAFDVQKRKVCRGPEIFQDSVDGARDPEFW